MKKTIDLTYLEILNERCVLKSQDKWVLINALDGHDGEADFEELALSVLPNGMILLMDLVFLRHYGETQIDAVILSDHQISCFEIKHFRSQYVYQDGVWTVNGKQKTRDYFTQMKRAAEIFSGILREIGVNAEVESRLVLMGDEDTVAIRDARVEGQYLKRWQLKDYIRKLDHDADWQPKWNAQELAKELLKRATVRTIPKVRPVAVEDKKVYRGIVCCDCGGYEINVESQRYHVVCQHCGYWESKEKAVLRTICDLAILAYDEPLTKNIMSYYKGSLEIRNTTKRVFRKYFQLKVSGRAAEYINPVQRMDEAFGDVKFRYKDYQGRSVRS